MEHAIIGKGRMGQHTLYSTNTLNIPVVEHFFRDLGYNPKYIGTKPAAIGMGQTVEEFTVPGFSPASLDALAREQWQALPLEVVGKDDG